MTNDAVPSIGPWPKGTCRRGTTGRRTVGNAPILTDPVGHAPGRIDYYADVKHTPIAPAHARSDPAAVGAFVVREDRGLPSIGIWSSGVMGMVMEELIPAATLSIGPRAAVSVSLLDAVRGAWGLGTIVDMTGLADVGGTYNLNVRLQTDRGDIVMRVYRPWVRPERLAAVQALREALWQAGVPVITPLVRPDGSTMLTFGDRLIEVEPWVSSDGGADSWERYLASAADLGRLHVALRQVELPVPFVPAPVSNVLSEAVFGDWLARTRWAVSSVPSNPRSLAALHACGEAERLRRTIAAIPMASPLMQLTHGDFADENIRFFGATPVAILDFDFADYRDRLSDIAYLCYWMFEYLQSGTPAAARDWRRVSGIIQGFGSTSGLPLTADEIRRLPLMMAIIPLNWVAEAWLKDDPVAAVGVVSPWLSTAAWMLANHADLAGMWLDDQS